MAGTSISVEVTGDLKRFEENLAGLVYFDFTGLNQKIGQAVLNSTLERFKQGVDPEGKPWPESGRASELSGQAEAAAQSLKAMGRGPSKRKNESAAQRRAREKAVAERQVERRKITVARRFATDHKTLIDTARLRNSLHVVATPDQAEVGTDVIYARIHQFGGETGRGGATKLPARTYLGMNDDDIRIIGAIVEDHITEKAKL